MRGFLDDEALDGPHEVEITFRPERVAEPIPADDLKRALEVISEQCQIWGGATTPLIPLANDGTVGPIYRRIISGSAIDRFRGLRAFELGSDAPLTPKTERRNETRWGSQFAPALLDYGRQETYAQLEVVELADDDPWQAIYAACLGLLPPEPSPELLAACYLIPDLRFEDFVRLDRVETRGSLEDLLARLSNDTLLTPRRLSMIELSYGNSGSTSIREQPTVLPSPGFARFDAGPNVIVACSPGSLEDIALLWNLRGASGDLRPLPIGVLIDELTPAVVDELISSPRIAINGFPIRAAYVTSASVKAATLTKKLATLLEGPRPAIGVLPQSEMLTFGLPGGWRRDEVVVWREGRARLAPLPLHTHQDVLQRATMSDQTRVAYDISVPSRPFPSADDIRIEAANQTFAAGHQTTSGRTVKGSSGVHPVDWPSTFLMARAVAKRRGFAMTESEPGRACRVLLSGMKDLSAISLLAHAPLLELLEIMATRHGFGWYKDRLRARGDDADPTFAVAATSDDLPERPFGDFKKALGNNERATKQWLLWAEQAGLILKGFPLQCVMCRAKQWIPVIGFASPVVCRGCGEVIETPFGDRPTVTFMYRLSERLRRVYEHDAMGHLLVSNYFDTVLSGGKSGWLVGLHPGMEVRLDDEASTVVGEADVFLFTSSADFVPVEIKRRSTGLAAAELEKLTTLGVRLNAPWTAVASCEYATGSSNSDSLASLARRRRSDGTYERMVLTYDQLLDPRAGWAMGSDPFTLKALDPDAIAEREESFVRRLADRSVDGAASWLEFEMLEIRRPRKPPTASE